jgi:RimJ/RimL family protein N-acetyltransferase
MRNPYLIGAKVYLRPFDPVEDSTVTAAWFNDSEVNRFMRRCMPMTVPEQEAFLRRTAGSVSDMAVAVVEQASDQLIGATGLHDIDPRNRHAQFGITIGDKTAWGKGFGTEATRLMVRHAFASLNLNRVYLEVYEYNERARHVYEKLGFQIEGRLRQHTFRDGRYWDTFIMGVLRDEWRTTPSG